MRDRLRVKGNALWGLHRLMLLYHKTPSPGSMRRFLLCTLVQMIVLRRSIFQAAPQEGLDRVELWAWVNLKAPEAYCRHRLCG